MSSANRGEHSENGSNNICSSLAFSWLSPALGAVCARLPASARSMQGRYQRSYTEYIRKEVIILIIAVDFDGIICENKFPKIGNPNYEVISLVRQLIDMGHEVILWTSRTDQELNDAIEFCKDRGLHFCAINENAPSNISQYIDKYPQGTRKVYADIYIDDHNLEFVSENDGFDWLLKYLRKLIKRRIK